MTRDELVELGVVELADRVLYLERELARRDAQSGERNRSPTSSTANDLAGNETASNWP